MLSQVLIITSLLSLISSVSAQTYSASITEYGLGDDNGSGNCNSPAASCGFYNSPGFNVAVSQNLFGASSGVGSACGTCWSVTPETDSSGNPLNGASSIVVMVNNLCPADGNALCSQPTLEDVNYVGAQVNFDLCIQSGAAGSLFGSSGQGMALGTVTQVDCSEWSGSGPLTS